MLFHSHTRLRVRPMHPAFPAPSVFEGMPQNSGGARCENTKPYLETSRLPGLHMTEMIAGTFQALSCLIPHGKSAMSRTFFAYPEELTWLS
jgi:hypothetical protein